MVKKLQDNFTFSTSIEDGKRFILRFRQSLWEIVDNNAYPYQVGIAIPIEHRENEFPGKEENKLLLILERKLRAELEKNNLSIYAGAIIGNGMKEFVFYTNEPKEVQSTLNKFKKNTEGYTLQVIIQLDQEWKVFKMYCPKP